MKTSMATARVGLVRHSIALRAAYGALAIGLLLAAMFEVTKHDTGLWQLLVFAVLPDVAILAGMGRGLARGQLHPRAVPLYNALHRFPGATLLLLSSPWTSMAWLVAGLAWAMHIAFDRALGLGLLDRQGLFRATQNS